MAFTVKQLVEQLQQIENQDQPVIFQYYLKEHFEYGDETEVRDEDFLAVAEKEGEVSWSIWEEANNIINDWVWEASYRRNDGEDEDESEDETEE